MRHRASFSETKSKKISKNLFWVRHRASFLETKSRQKSWLPGDNLIFWVIFWDTCSWKGQLGRTRSWKVLSWKVWSWKVWLKLERDKRNWKEPIEVGKNRGKLERTERSWKASFEVGKFRWSWKVSPQLESSGWSWKVWMNLESCDWCWEVHHKFQIRVRETYKFGLGLLE